MDQKKNKVKKVKQRQSSFSAIFGLFAQHSKLQNEYWDIAEELDEVHLKAWIHRLANFHDQQRDELQELLQILPEAPVKLAEESKTYLDKRENELIKALNRENQFDILQLIGRAEQSLYDQYSNTLQLETLVDEVKEKLSRQHAIMLRNLRKVQRVSSISSVKSLEAVLAEN